MKPYFTDEQATLYLGDALTALQSLPDASINCCVTSPPYFGLRSYLPDGVVLRDDLTDDERAYVLGELGSAGDRMTAVIFSKSQIPEHLHRYFRPAEIGAEVRSRQPQAPAGARRLAELCYEHARLHPTPTSESEEGQ